MRNGKGKGRKKVSGGDRRGRGRRRGEGTEGKGGDSHPMFEILKNTLVLCTYVRTEQMSSQQTFDEKL